MRAGHPVLRVLAAAAVLAAGGGLASPTAARAQAVSDDVGTEARAHHERGRQFFKDGDYVAAAVEFDQAQALYGAVAVGPDGAVLDAAAHERRRVSLTNAATAWSQANLPVEALRTFRLLRDLYAGSLPADEVAAIDAAIAQLETRVGTVRLAGLPAGAGADIRLDGRAVPADAGERPFPVAAGEHALEVQARGFKPFVTRFTVVGQQAAIVTVTLEPSDTPARVRIVSSEEPAEIWVDGKQVGTSPAEVTLAPGSHRFEVKAEGFRAYEGTIEAQPGERQVVTAGLIPRRTPTGVRIEPHFAAVIPMRDDTPFEFGLSSGVRLFHEYVRFRGARFGMAFEFTSRELNSFGFGTVITWCPDSLSWGVNKEASRGAQWCPVTATFLKTFGGESGVFQSGENAGRLTTDVEAHFGPLFFRFGAGVGYESYKRSALVNLLLMTATIDVAVGMDL